MELSRFLAHFSPTIKGARISRGIRKLKSRRGSKWKEKSTDREQFEPASDQPRTSIGPASNPKHPKHFQRKLFQKLHVLPAVRISPTILEDKELRLISVNMALFLPFTQHLSNENLVSLRNLPLSRERKESISIQKSLPSRLVCSRLGLSARDKCPFFFFALWWAAWVLLSCRIFSVRKLFSFWRQVVKEQWIEHQAIDQRVDH